MTESEIIRLRDKELASFTDTRCKKVLEHWKPTVERAPNGWLLYRIGNDKGLAYTEGADWEDAPWTVVHRLATDRPLNAAYCQSLEDAVDHVIY